MCEVLGMPITDRQAQRTPRTPRTPRDEDKPQSPQCMTSLGPQMAGPEPEESGAVSLSKPADAEAAAAEMFPDSDAEMATAVAKQASKTSHLSAKVAHGSHGHTELFTGPSLWLQQPVAQML
ncbi:unnamed protein product [Symbiodinium natans]|uniref:Uncharacterized protein n=1 Tax=Symbiodinium natans TaxID=878477 RepID=A0A812L5C4_9DINO|nr:unnamed protein product [Symbiodinium natans]